MRQWVSLEATPENRAIGISAVEDRARQTSGVLLLDKPIGMSSNAAVQKARRLFDRVKAGHTGTLDPLASGLLPICLGEATKFSHALLDADKAYLATARLGWRSSTGDSEGELYRVGAPDFDQVTLDRAVEALTGEIEQVPPMYSAVKVNGQPLYALARKGLNVERKPRTVHINRLEVKAVCADSVSISVSCSKGTYVRVLAEELGQRLGCGAYLTALRRVLIGTITIDDAVGLDDLESLDPPARSALLKPVDFMLSSLPPVSLSLDDGVRLCHGLAIRGTGAGAGLLVRVYREDGRFLGTAEVDDEGVLKPKRLVSTAF